MHYVDPSDPTRPKLTPEQRDVLEDTHRIRVVRAGPGSGKTRVFVAELVHRLSSWTSHTGGIAALSFTNVAADEIARRLGGAPPHPHYVGTLDSFVWRFIVRPFALIAQVTQRGPRLIPAPVQQTLDRPVLKYGSGEQKRDSLFNLVLQLRDGKPSVMRHDRYSGRLHSVEERFVSKIVEAKRREWAKNGRLTHADSHAVAWEIMQRDSHAKQIIGRLAVRFPLILLDEFQDTNFFLGRVLREVIRHEGIRALVVGDRDQAIYRFGGADSNLFREVEELPGASALSLRTTHRFGSHIAVVASMLSRSGDAIRDVGGPSGRVLLVEHNCGESRLDSHYINSLKKILETEGCATTAFLARKKAWLDESVSGGGSDICPLSSMTARNLHSAVGYLRVGESRVAMDLVGRCLEELVLGGEFASSEQLQHLGIDRLAWRRSLRAILFSAAEQRPGDTWSAWLVRVKDAVRNEVAGLRANADAKAIGAMFRQGFRKNRSDGSRAMMGTRSVGGPWEAMTVHRAKGREFDGVVIYWPKPGGRARVGCPSKEWWSEDPDSEEREIAYVAATRAKKVLVFCLHKETVTALRASRPEFVENLETAYTLESLRF